MNTPSRIPGFPPAALLAATALLLSGCAHWARTSPPSGEILVAETENIYVTGSYIPIRVPKSGNVRILPTISPLTILTRDDLARAVAPSGAPMH